MLGRTKRIRRNTYRGRRPNRRAAFLAGCGLTFRLTLASGLFLLFNLALVFSYDWITQTHRFGIRTVTVRGCERLAPEAVKQQAGLAEAENILAVNLTTARKRLLAHPWIAEAQVAREIPDRLVIVIREHACLAVLDLGRRFLLSDRGEVFKELAPGEIADRPVVSGLTYTDLGLEAKDAAPVLRAVLRLLKPHPRSGWQPVTDRIRGIHADPDLGLTVFLSDERQPGGYGTVMLGFDDFEAKFAMLRKIEAYLQERDPDAGLRSIDLKSRQRIIVHTSAPAAAENAGKEV